MVLLTDKKKNVGAPSSSLPRIPGPRPFSTLPSAPPFPQVVAFKSDGSVLLNELQVNLPYVAGESCSRAPPRGGGAT